MSQRSQHEMDRRPAATRAGLKIHASIGEVLCRPSPETGCFDDPSGYVVVHLGNGGGAGPKISRPKKSFNRANVVQVLRAVKASNTCALCSRLLPVRRFLSEFSFRFRPPIVLYFLGVFLAWPLIIGFVRHRV
jgi:hypothetical protein